MSIIIPPLLLKLKALIVSTQKKELKNFEIMNKGNLDDVDFSHSRPMFKVLSILIISSGGIALAAHLGLKKAKPLFTKKLVEEALKFKKTLIQTHTKEQQRLWDEIRRSQEKNNSLTAHVRDSLVNSNGEVTNISYLDIFKVLLHSKKSLEIEISSKWLSIQLQKYETSLNHNQLILYKNLYETEMKIAMKTTIMKSIFYVGVPYILFHLVGATQAGNLKKWEKAING